MKAVATHESFPHDGDIHSRHGGYYLAVVSTVLLVTDGLLMLITSALTGVYLWGPETTLDGLFTRSIFPVALYSIWGLGVFGTGGAICAIAVYGFRERWFWRWLVVASIMWLIFPPVHAIIGLISLIMLLSSRKHFVKRQPAGH